MGGEREFADSGRRPFASAGRPPRPSRPDSVLRCEGLARVDFFFEEGRRGFLINEINTMPGFTPISMYPKLWAKTGVSYPQLVDRLIASPAFPAGNDSRPT